MDLLPKELWKIEPIGDSHVAAGIHEVRGAYHWTKFALADLPNDLLGVDDLKRHGIILNRVDMAPISQPVGDAST